MMTTTRPAYLFGPCCLMFIYILHMYGFLISSEMYFSSLLVRFSKSEIAKLSISFTKYNMLSPTGDPRSPASKLVYLCLSQVIMVMVNVVMSMLIMEIKMIMMMMRMSTKFFPYVYQITTDHQNTNVVGSKSVSVFHRILLCRFEASTSLLPRLTSAWPGYHDYGRMMDDDECAVCICM